MARLGLRNTRGFSLIELSMLLAMTAVVAAIAVPVLTDSMHGMQLLSEARKIATTMSYAKIGATSQLTSYQLAFDLDNNQWRVLKRNRATGNWEQQQDMNRLSLGMANSAIAFKTSSDSAPTGFSGTSATTIIFNARGIPAGAAVVYLSNEDTDYAVSVSIAGKVQIWRLGNNGWDPV